MRQACKAPCFPKCADPAEYEDELCKAHHTRKLRGMAITTPIIRKVGKRRPQTSVRVSPECQVVLELVAANQGKTVAALIESIVEEWAKTALPLKT